MNNKKGFLFKLLCITVFFNIWFPKAGIKLSGVPLTVGNIFFGLTFLFWIVTKIRQGKIRTVKINSIIIMGIWYYILKYIIIFKNIGTIIPSITFIIPLIIYPIMFFIIIDSINKKEEIEKIIKIIIYGFFFLCLYSIIQYFIGIDKCDIPGITVNLTDYKEMGSTWYLGKCNGLDVENSKIISTYQNGNLFGINILFMYPIIYYYFRKNEKLQTVSLILFIICTFLTLSRTCWFGIVLFIFFGIIMENKKTKKAIGRKIVIISISIISLFIVFSYMPSVANRFLDTDASDWVSMSGRTEGLITVLKTVFNSGSILAWFIGPQGIVNYDAVAYEMLPTSIFAQTGLIGMVFLYAIFIKSYIYLNDNNYIQKSIRLSLLIWLIIGCIECGYWLPPTALNIFTMLGLGYVSKNLNKEV